MTTIPIPDPWLRRALREATGSKAFTPEALAGLAQLDWSEYRAEAEMDWGAIKDIAPLCHCSNLRVRRCTIQSAAETVSLNLTDPRQWLEAYTNDTQNG